MDRELSYDERATYGECPICKAPHGQWCDSFAGVPIGSAAFSETQIKGAHLGRLQKAPMRIRETPIY